MSKKQPHIQISNKENARYAIFPGDPSRVDRVGKHLDQTKILAHNREFKTISGYYKGIKILVTSSGIGGASAAIAIEQLKEVGVHTIIRIGSCGALNENIKLGDLIISTGAVRDDGASLSYIKQQYPAVPDYDVLNAMITSSKKLNYKSHLGLTRSHDSYYIDNQQEITDYWNNAGILGEDLETATLFVVGRLRGVKTGSILNNVVEYNTNLESGINEYVNKDEILMEGERKEILVALESIVILEEEI